MSHFLWELGCEEIPARMLPDALNNLASMMSTLLQEAGISFGSLSTLGTPRRLAVLIDDLATQQADRQEIRRGPPVDRAFDAAGKPTGAALGFAKSCGVSIEAIGQEEMGKGVYLVYRETIPGSPVAQVLPLVMDKVVKTFSWPKSMRWGSGEFRFVRPILTMTALLDGELLPFSVAQAGSSQGVTTGRTVAGHRFMSPGPFEIHGPQEYASLLRQNKVMVDFQERSDLIREEVTKQAAGVQGTAIIDAGLLSENACLTEWPVALRGQFDPVYLDIPKEVLVTSMKNHQKYFAVVDQQGKLLPNFIAIANIEAPNPQVLINGYQRVLKARLEDAAFYWGEDRKKSLQERQESLKSVVFQARLGTLYQKSQRIRSLAEKMAAQLAPNEIQQAAKAALLCKCDLVTGMVGEFPELQGIMGGYYARHDGEEDSVAQAIAQHYRPQGAADELPTTPLATILSLADKLDTLAGCFGVGLAPTGAKDPFALRRAALGIIRMLLNGQISLPLQPLLMEACQRFVEQGVLQAGEVPSICQTILTFFHGRLEPYLRGEGLEYDLIDAVLALAPDNLYDAAVRIRSLARFKGMASYGSLVAANKRIANILNKSVEEGVVIPTLNPQLLSQEAEQRLVQEVTAVGQQVTAAGSDYGQALDALATLREAIDQFFDAILVMDPDPAIRGNRLALLHQVRETFRRVADISRLAPEAA
ncbi:MAG: glycine--tRNA ligase subunit beta [Magnetococcales bacterium]|nr:glycine--tRNA ligase subunit beta [Magnetococcales bacterium]NGZ28264.1 glycine--tRNA ligase subunit beta [Magnetococcales bacterium]